MYIHIYIYTYIHACMHIEEREMTEHISDSEHLAIFRVILAGRFPSLFG